MQFSYLKFDYYGESLAPADWCWQLHPYNHCNRLYYIRGGKGWYSNESGIRHPFRKGWIYFFPRGSTYYLCQDSEERLDHLYFDFLCVPLPSGTEILEIPAEGDAVLEHTLELLHIFVSKGIYPICPPALEVTHYVRHYFTALLEYLSERCGIQYTPSGAVQDAIIFMLEHFNEPITMNEVADKVGYNPKYFIRIFSAAMQSTPYQFLRDLRIGKALSLISSGTSVAAAAEAVGFQNASSLSNAIRKSHLTAPSQV